MKNNKKWKFVSIIILLLLPFGLIAQELTVRGKVINSEDQLPLPGVAVVIKGTTRGTVTDADGSYSLSNVHVDATLVFSFVGMKTMEVPVAGQTIINVAMQEDVISLEEVVAIGYGVMRKSDLTGSVSQVKDDDIRKISPTQVTEALSGTVAGLYSLQGNKAAGGGSLQLRGPSSLAASTTPLIVLDGVIYPGSLSEINPNDVESIDILRDASSAAIFGARSAAGVILITTKKGETGKPTINFSAKVGVSTTTNDFYPYGMDPDGDPMDYFRMHRDHLYERSQGALPYYYYWHPDELPSSVNVEEWLNYVDNPNSDPLEEWFNRIKIFPTEKENYLAGRTTNFYDLCIGSGIRQDYSMSIGGAYKDLKYYWSIGYLNNEGIIKGDAFSTIRSRLNLDFEITNWLKVGTNTQFSFRDESVVEANLGNMSLMSPYGSMWNEDGTLRTFPNDYTINNPLENYYGQERKNDTNSLFSVLYGELQLPFGITFRTSYQPRFAFTKDFNFWSSKTVTGYQTYKNGYATRDHTNSFGWMWDNLLKWNKTFGVHTVDFTFLVNAERYKSWYSRQYASEFAPNENLGFHALQFGGKPGVSDSDAESSGDALMARLNYTLKDKYLFTASVRRDGYSAFGQLNPRATFPAFAFAWKISEEPFYNIPWMERLKLRLSWGENGNREIGAYSALAQLGSVLSYDGSNVEMGVYNSRLSNAGLRWERTESFNVGFDIGLFGNRIDLSVDAYIRETHDLLLNRQLPRITGFSSVTSNLGVLANKGIEATINTVNIDNPNFSWRSSLVFSLNRNEIKELWGDYGDYKILNKEYYGELPDLQNQWFPGYARDIVWDYERIGIWQIEEKDEAAKYGLKPGDAKVVDVNDDGKLTQFEDKKFIGYREPRSRWGFRNDFDFCKYFSASVFIRADLGNIREVPGITSDKSTLDRRNDWGWGYWSPENPDAKFPRNAWPDNYGRYGGGIRFFESTGFLRIQDLSLSYTIPSAKMPQILPFQSLRLIFTGRNLLTITKWPGFDPESGTVPMPMTFTVGVDITL